jgi:CheY-like chemotaxis protein
MINFIDNKFFIRTLVKDTGIGISKENHENIFRRFSQVENTIKTTNGVGLGLAIAKELVEKLGGSIALESEVGEGSIFTVDIPFIFVKENEKFRVKNKELIILSDKIEYMDNYIKNAKNIEGLNFIIVEDIKEFYTVFDQEDTLNTYVLVDFEDNKGEIKKIYENFGERFLYIKNSENFDFINKDRLVNREFLEEALKNIFGLIKEKNDQGIRDVKNFEKTPIKILLVEDDLINREAFKILLESLGLRELTIAVDGEEALECYYKGKYDIIFMDLQIPKKNGFEVLEIIRAHEEKENKEKSTIITLTANALEGFREKCLEKGFDDYLTKPLTRDKLFEKIEYYIKNNNHDFEELKNQY